MIRPTLNAAKKIRVVYAVKDNLEYICQPLFGRGVGWRCGKCKRGILHSWDRKCKVCKSKIRVAHLERREDWDK